MSEAIRRIGMLARMAGHSAALSLVLTALGSHCQAPRLSSGRLPTLTTTRQAHTLTRIEALRGFPVKLRGVVTFYDPYQEGHPALFIADSTGSIFVQLEPKPILALHAGSVVEVMGISDPGGYAPIVTDSAIHILEGSEPLPSPKSVTLPHLLSGTEDGQWVSIEGLVHSVESYGKHMVLTLATTDGLITANTVREAGVDYGALVDSKILIPGVAAPLVDGRGQMMGVRILFPSFNAIRIEEPAPADPFALPLRSLNDLLQYSPSHAVQHRVHLQGSVALDWPGRILCIQNPEAGLCVRSDDPRPLTEGTLIDVAGFPAREDYQPTLSDVIFRASGKAMASVPIRLTPEQALKGNHNDELVQIEGRLLGKSLVGGNPALQVTSGETLFTAILPSTDGRSGTSGEEDRRLPWVDGSRIVLTGVLSGKVDAWHITRLEGISYLESFQLLMRSPADVRVVETPSWWSSEHTLMVLGAVAVLTLSVLVWVGILRRRVAQQTELIRRSEENYRHQAEHDPLTGLVVRTVLLDRLEAALKEFGGPDKCIALMVMDVDNFKCVNDTLGHASGDAVLCVVARRLQASVRETDTVARMGGDEFTVLLAGIRGPEEAMRIAGEIVANISVPFVIRGCEVPVSMSVGVTTYPDGGEDAPSLLHNADVAMYNSKSLGRNRFELFSREMTKSDKSKSGIYRQVAAMRADSALESQGHQVIDARAGV